jgi:hypothetical protein
MTSIYSHEIQQQLKGSLELLEMILGPDLLGFYLYGSSVVGGLQKYSDISDLKNVITEGLKDMKFIEHRVG